MGRVVGWHGACNIGSMNQYLVEQGGDTIGEYNAATPLGAWRAMLADCGYNTESEVEALGYTLDDIGYDFDVTELD